MTMTGAPDTHGGSCPDTCASMQEAQYVFGLLVDRFHRSGWLLCLYGSVIRSGHGRDIDLMAVNWRERPMPPDMLIAELAEPGFKIEKGVFNGVESVKFMFGQSLLDVQFRESEIRRYSINDVVVPVRYRDRWMR